MAIHRKNIITIPPNMECNPKKTKDQAKLRANCTAKIIIAYLTAFLSNPSLHTKNKAIPIRTYKVDQIGPNAQFGGVHSGLARVEYQVVISGKVARLPIVPVTNTIKIEKISLGNSLILKLSIFYLPDSYNQNSRTDFIIIIFCFLILIKFFNSDLFCFLIEKLK